MRLFWGTPRRAMSREEWGNISADGAPGGVYTPNMSESDRRLWKAKRIGGADRRVEIRKSLGGTQMLIVVRPPGTEPLVRLSLNAAGEFTAEDWRGLFEAVAEATLDLTGG